MRKRKTYPEKKYIPCFQCGNDVRYWEYLKHTKRFCSNKCKGDWVRDNEQEKSIQKASYARKFRDNDLAWKKGLTTRKTNGNIIENPTWKQYWKKCDYLTRKIRQSMIESWDGYDYIDGEYIKENLNLHYNHSNYPTLDHLISKSECFKKGLTPEQATNPKNLKFTKRINNSRKHTTSVEFNKNFNIL